ncbi:uncharacterized protein LOC134185101 isoform X2 [Corticium candelabrum]|uniref:uncharacterized protein LOC134185101 isoform X2 n=1 Tax=Corticium candelabrum TaxID=121492 RepID=UPI002E382106|nr:uncharacterized protein LOC134185101 isoform X2 [Corticium candelabrum]
MLLRWLQFFAGSVAVLLSWIVVASSDLAVYELQARCAAHCLIYDPKGQYPSLDWGPYSFGSNFEGCISPCESIPNLHECQRLCETSLDQENCTSSCSFLEEIRTSQQTHLKQRNFPLTIEGRPNYDNQSGVLSWTIPRQIYKTKPYLHLPVSFVVQSALVTKKQYLEGKTVNWQWQSYRPVLHESIYPSSLFDKVDQNAVYVFRVATFNQYGTRGFSAVSLPVILIREHVVDCHTTDNNGSYPLRPESVFYSDYFLSDESDNTMSVNITWNPPATGVQPSCYQLFISRDSDTSDCEYYQLEVTVPSTTIWYTVKHLVPGCTYLVAIVSEPTKLGEDGTIDDKFMSSVVIEVPECHSTWCSEPGHNHSIPRDVDVTYMFDSSTTMFNVKVTWKLPVVTIALTGFDVTWGTMFESIAVENRIVNVDVKEQRETYDQYIPNFKPGALYFVEVTAIHYGEVYEAAPRREFQTPSLYPASPVNVQVEVMDGSVLVSWIEPEGTSIYFITSYFVLWGTTLMQDYPEISVEAGHYGNLSTSSDTFQSVLRLLKPATEYYVQVAAVSSNGPGAMSDPKRFWSPAASPSDPDQSDSIVIYIACPIAAVTIVCVIAIVIAFFVNRVKKEVKFEVTTTASSDNVGGESNDKDGNKFVRRFVPKVSPDDWEVDPARINIVELLGEGFFGVVVKADVVSRAVSSPTVPPSQDMVFGIEHRVPRSVSTTRSLLSNTSFSSTFERRRTVVAIKMLKDGNCESGQQDLLEEIKMMKRVGSHPYIVNMLGCVTQSVPLMLLVEFVSGGDLLTYLRQLRPERLSTSVRGQMNEYTPEPKSRETKSRSRSRSRECTHDESDDDVFTGKCDKAVLPAATSSLSFQDLITFAKQIALGMHHLGSKGVVHRDLACRNVLVDVSNKLVKVSDFGLARAVYKDEAYITTKRGFLPLKWMSVEAIFDRTFTTSSDIWSFGVVVWEICTLGGIPYPCVDDDVLANKLRQGYRMSKPENCSCELYEIMKRCWHPDPDCRPTFYNVSNWLDALNLLEMKKSSDRSMPWLSASDLDSEMSSPNPSVS